MGVAGRETTGVVDTRVIAITAGRRRDLDGPGCGRPDRGAARSGDVDARV